MSTELGVRVRSNAPAGLPAAIRIGTFAPFPPIPARPSAGLPGATHSEREPGPRTLALAVPGSKSITNRALVLAALSRGVTTLQGSLWSEDTAVMVDCLGRLGIEVRVDLDPAEPANRRLVVSGCGGRIPRAGTPESPLELFVANAGTAARFLAALVCLGRGHYRLSGTDRMHQRPQASLFRALRELGYLIDSPQERLPAVIQGTGPARGRCGVSIAESSQFASALLLCSGAGGWTIDVTDENEEESSYVTMTRRLLDTFPAGGGEFVIEPDASSGSYFWAAAWLLTPQAARDRAGADWRAAAPLSVGNWPGSGWQIDARFPEFLPLPARVSRAVDLADSILTAMILAPFAPRPTVFTDLGRLRVQECERVLAMRTGLGECGVRTLEEGDSLTVFPSVPRPGRIDTCDDHRIAMCFAILGLMAPGMVINNPACVKKTFPGFFQRMAAPPPEGLGVRLSDALDSTAQPLPWEALAAG
jgi:3-phosphoshikimate 1-carboxyvinyltransferase